MSEVKLRHKYNDDLEIIQIEKDLLQQCKNMRKYKDITQTDLAKVMEVDSKLVSKMESAKNSPLLRNFIRYINALGIELVIKEKSK